MNNQNELFAMIPEMDGLIAVAVDNQPLRYPVRIDDICSQRHSGNVESMEANAKVDKSKGRQDVLDVLKIAPATSKEIAEILLTELHKVTPRVSELKSLGLVTTTGVRRLGAAELMIV